MFCVMARYTHSTSADEYARFLGLLIDCCDTNYEPMKFLGLQSSLGEAHRVRGGV